MDAPTAPENPKYRPPDIATLDEKLQIATQLQSKDAKGNLPQNNRLPVVSCADDRPLNCSYWPPCLSRTLTFQYVGATQTHYVSF